METISFSFNWNNKLECNAFTTIRIYSERKHVQGALFHVKLKGVDKGIIRLEEVKPFHLANLNSFIAYLDTGYSVENCTQIIHKMYPDVDFTKVKLALLLCVKQINAK